MAFRRDARDARALTAGLVALLVVTIVYPLIAASAARPLAMFLLPALLVAVLGGWRQTLFVGSLAFGLAVLLGLAGPLDSEALIARWTIVVIGIAMGVLAAAARERQAGRVAELDEAVALREAFERALAPPPVAPHRFLAVARYRPAEPRMEVGGDFLEAIGLSDSRLGVLIGDVCGHGPREAAFGAALRAGWKSIALGGKSDPGDWMAAVHNAFFRDGRIDTFVTMYMGYLDIDIGVGRFVNAGHPAPVLWNGAPQLLEVPPAPPMGMGLGETWAATEIEWDGSPMLFYTDGLIENPKLHGPADRWGTEGLLAWMGERTPDRRVDMLVDELLSAASAGRDARDDVAVLMVAARP